MSSNQGEAAAQAPPTVETCAGDCNARFPTRFRSGQSGNPRGRPRSKRTLGAVLATALRERVEVGSRRVSKLEAAVGQIVDGALTGDLQLAKLLVTLLRAKECGAQEPDVRRHDATSDYAEGDALVIAELRRRFGPVRPFGRQPYLALMAHSHSLSPPC